MKMPSVNGCYIYHVELNRCVYDNSTKAMDRLRNLGMSVRKVPFHPTLLRVARPVEMPWAKFCSSLRSTLQPGKGSAFVTSPSGRRFLCAMKRRRGAMKRLK